MYSIFISISISVYAAISNRKRKTEAQAIFLNLFTICSSCKRKLSICKRTKQKKQTCPSMDTSESENINDYIENSQCHVSKLIVS